MTIISVKSHSAGAAQLGKSSAALKRIAFSLLAVVASSAALAEQLVIASGGGTLQDAQRKAFFEPFEKETGIKVIDTTGMSLAKVKAMVETGNVEWDLFFSSPTPFFQSVKAGYIEKIDFGKLDKVTMEQMDPRMVNPYGVGSMFYAQVIAYSTKRFGPNNHPNSWADFWDTKKFPGVRVLPAGTYDQPPIEPALLAAGVSADKLYPPDLKLAYEMLTKISGSVKKWVTSGAGGPQALASGEADMAMQIVGAFRS